MQNKDLIRPLHDGKRFSYPSNDPVGSRWDVLRWAVTRKKTRWPATLNNPPAEPVKPRLHDEQLRITFINHASVLVQCEGLNIITDPVFSKRVSPVSFAGPKRFRAAGLSLHQLPPIDVILISHSHYDHLDVRSIAQIGRMRQNDQPIIIAPLNNGKIITNATGLDVIELNWWDSHTINKNANIHMVPARHWTSRKPGDENMALWGGFVMNFASGPVYFAGDTGYGDGKHFLQAHQQFGRFRCALLPIGAYEPRWFMKPQHMNPQEAVKAFSDLQAHYALGIHHGTFQLTDEGHDAPVKDLQQALREAQVEPDYFRVLPNGGAWDVAKTV